MTVRRLASLPMNTITLRMCSCVWWVVCVLVAPLFLWNRNLPKNRITSFIRASTTWRVNLSSSHLHTRRCHCSRVDQRCVGCNVSSCFHLYRFGELNVTVNSIVKNIRQCSINQKPKLIYFNSASIVPAKMISTYVIQTTALALLIAAIQCQPPSEQASLDDLIKEIFTTSPPTGDLITEFPYREPEKYAPTSMSNGHHTSAPPDQSNTLHPTRPEPNEENVSEVKWAWKRAVLTVKHWNIFQPCPVGECVPYYLCANGSIITDGEGILDVRFGEEDNPDKTFHPCKGLFNTCCSLKSDKPIIPPIVKKPGCGHRNYEGIGFRVTDRDNETQFGEFPWMAGR